MERLYYWGVGQIVRNRKDVEPYEIADVVGEAKNIHLARGSGYWHVYRSFPTKSGRRLIHHGGPKGFDDPDRVKRQHLHVINQLAGTSVELESEEPFTTADGKEVPDPAKTIRSEILHIPGEADRVREMAERLQLASQLLISFEGPAVVNRVRDDLTQLRSDLVRSRDPNKIDTREAIDKSLAGQKPQLLGATLGAQKRMHRRAEDIVDMIAATLARYGAIEQKLFQWDETFIILTRQLGRSVKDLKGGRKKEALDRIADPNVGARIQFSTITGVPHLLKAQLVQEELWTLEELLNEPTPDQAIKLLQDQIKVAKVWVDSRRAEADRFKIDLDLYSGAGPPPTI